LDGIVATKVASLHIVNVVYWYTSDRKVNGKAIANIQVCLSYITQPTREAQ